MKRLFLRIFNPPSKGKMENIDKTIEDLLLKGAISIVGIDNSGEFLYSMNAEIKNVMPELYNQHLQDVNSEIMNLWSKGFLSINLMEEDPMVQLTAKALDKQSLSTLSSDELWSLQEVKRVLISKS